jgi:hypothetical protein
MTDTTALSQTVWLLRNKLNPFPVASTLTLDGNELTLAMQPGAADAVLGWVAERLGTTVASLQADLAGDTPVVLARTNQFTVTWPKSFAGAAMELSIGDRTWLACLSYPTGGGLLQTINLISGRGRSKAWKAAFAALPVAC